jgi:cytochrome c biogenesis protein CcmG, thiol:disulfide interchange protein DsbE
MDQGRAGALGVALLALAACATGGAGDGPASGNQVGAPVPEIHVESLAGKDLGIADYRGKVLLLDVWASWCGPCKQELPMLDDMAKRLRADGIEVLAVSIDQERANLVKFLKARPRWALTIAHDPRGAIADRLAPEKMPTSYIIDREGIVRFVNSGFEPADAAVIERRLVDVARR